MSCQFGSCRYPLDRKIWYVKRSNKKLFFLPINSRLYYHVIFFFKIQIFLFAHEFKFGENSKNPNFLTMVRLYLPFFSLILILIDRCFRYEKEPCHSKQPDFTTRILVFCDQCFSDDQKVVSIRHTLATIMYGHC